MPDRFADRRRRLAELIGDTGIAIVPAATEVVRNHDVNHEFRQDSIFRYLTGFEEPDAVAVITPGHDEGGYTLFVLPKDPAQEVWTGIRTGAAGALDNHGADAAFELDRLDEVLERLMLGRDVIWYRSGSGTMDAKVGAAIERARAQRERHGVVVPSAIRDVSVPISEMMLFKDPSEIDSLRHACSLSAEGHREAMRFAMPGMKEYQVQAALEYYWRLGGSPRNGYPSIVAAGANACVLHYVSNDATIGRDDLVLIDAAAEVDGYSSDITRTFPANGRFNGPQRAVYDVVLAAQERGLSLCGPGATLRQVHDASTRVLVEGMVDLGLLPGPVDDAIGMHHYTEFFMHGTGHWLGMDVHDRGSYRVDGKPRPLEPGMVFTVEPGIYVAPEKAEIELTMLVHDLDEWNDRRLRLGRSAAAALEKEEKESAPKVRHPVPGDFLGVGVRIEDDVLIVTGGMENMTTSVPKEPDEVEALCAETPTLPRPQVEAITGTA
ncbi:MAG: aminopeptidase P N-terminal domain-containing protein [Actinobacteria bacterium]|nr:aminopeptidase P N-terminal domain-containing protein [Actinomycetota bacterium]